MNSGWSTSNCRSKYSRQFAISTSVGRAIVRRTAFEHVQDVDVGPPQLHSLFDDVGQELTGAADKRFTGSIFVGTGCLSEETESRLRRPHAKDRLRSRASEMFATSAGDDFAANVVQCFLLRRDDRCDFVWASRFPAMLSG